MSIGDIGLKDNLIDHGRPDPPLEPPGDIRFLLWAVELQLTLHFEPVQVAIHRRQQGRYAVFGKRTCQQLLMCVERAVDFFQRLFCDVGGRAGCRDPGLHRSHLAYRLARKLIDEIVQVGCKSRQDRDRESQQNIDEELYGLILPVPALFGSLTLPQTLDFQSEARNSF